jgi:hypothetical protein
MFFRKLLEGLCWRPTKTGALCGRLIFGDHAVAMNDAMLL